MLLDWTKKHAYGSPRQQESARGSVEHCKASQALRPGQASAPAAPAPSTLHYPPTHSLTHPHPPTHSLTPTHPPTHSPVGIVALLGARKLRGGKAGVVLGGGGGSLLLGLLGLLCSR